jgi:hypothetical protein
MKEVIKNYRLYTFRIIDEETQRPDDNTNHIYTQEVLAQSEENAWKFVREWQELNNPQNVPYLDKHLAYIAPFSRNSKKPCIYGWVGQWKKSRELPERRWKEDWFQKDNSQVPFID